MTAIDPIPTEGPVAKTIEQRTAHMPSDWFLWAAAGSIATSLLLQVSGKQQAGSFVGQWAPTLLILGVYNKLVKQLGSDHATRAETGAATAVPNSPRKLGAV